MSRAHSSPHRHSTALQPPVPIRRRRSSSNSRWAISAQIFQSLLRAGKYRGRKPAGRRMDSDHGLPVSSCARSACLFKRQRAPQWDAPRWTSVIRACRSRFGFALIATPSRFSIYNGGIVSVRKSFASHYSVLANYTYSKSIDVATDVQLTDTPQNYLDPAADRSVGDNDIRHRATLSFVAESPETWALPLRNLKLSMLNTLQSPRSSHYSPDSIYSATACLSPIELEPLDATPIVAHPTTTAICGCRGSSISPSICQSSPPLKVSTCSITAMCRASTKCMEPRTSLAPSHISSAMEL